MAAIKITSFGGMAPSVSPRALSPDGAQVNENLFLGINEFRPLSVDNPVAASPAGTKSLYRFERKVDGEFNTDPNVGWIFSNVAKSYVKGQINDERTERTYVSTDDGSQPPRAIDVTGQDRRLGVPRPTKPTATLQVADELTSEEANTFLYTEVVDAVKLALTQTTPLLTVEPGSRYSGTTIYGGPQSFHGSFTSAFFTGQSFSTNHWVAWFRVQQSTPVGQAINDALLGAYTDAGNVYTYIPLVMLPAVYRPDYVALATKLRAIESPADGSQLFDEAQITELTGKLTKLLNPSEFAKTQRDRMEQLAKDFKALLASPIGTNSPRPIEPVKPTVPEYIETGGDFVS